MARGGVSPVVLLLPLAVLPLLMRGKARPRAAADEWQAMSKRLIASTDAIAGMALGSGPVQQPDRTWTLHPGWYFTWVPPAGFQRLHSFLIANDANCKIRVSYGDDEWGHAFVFEVPGPALLRWWMKSQPHSAPNERATTIDEISHAVGLDTEATSQGFWTYYQWASRRQPTIVDSPDEQDVPPELADEQRGGEHYGGDHPMDHQHRIWCAVCNRQGWSFVRHADLPDDIDQRGVYSIEWFRTDPGWTMVLPVRSDSSEGYRCPDHSFPRPSKTFGPPPPPERVVKPGWYWFWVRPGAQQAAWRAMRVRWGAPVYILKPRKTWADVFVGSLELFEVVGADMVWSMPASERLGMSMPRPAAKGAETTLFDILGEGL